jgi:hypothetical protein
VTENQTDQITVSRQFRKSLKDVRSKRGADIGSDHHLTVAQFRMKLKTNEKNWKKLRGDMM